MTMATLARQRLKAFWVHLVRVLLLAAILGVIHFAHARSSARQQAGTLAELPLGHLQGLFPNAERLGEAESHGGRAVLDAAGESLGFVIQTAPASDRYLGFSGPTNCLIGFGKDETVVGVAILSSRDTRDHVELIVRERAFLRSWEGLSWEGAASRTDIDGVAGATLTSLAIMQGVQQRLGASARAVKFPKPLVLDDAKALFPDAERLEADGGLAALWQVFGGQGEPLGSILRTSPAADEVIGYQGPTETRIGIRPDGEIVGIAVGASFDNEPYVTYVRKDDYFRELFRKYDLPGLAELDLKAAGIEGVSGATMTSLAVARGLIEAAQEHEAAIRRQEQQRASRVATTWRTVGTIAIIAFGVILGSTSLRKRAWLRVSFQVLLIAYLGLTAGDLLSLAMFVGWSESGIPWQNAPGLVALALAALALPIARGDNLYCAHLCPHGAAQQLLPRRWKLRHSWPGWVGKTLRLIRPALLAWVLVVAVCRWPFSLVDIEAFDAYSWRAAAWPTIAIAVGGLVASLFVPMAYCRYGCPTGALLNYLRRHGRSDRLSRADFFAAACLVVGGVLLALGGSAG